MNIYVHCHIKLIYLVKEIILNYFFWAILVCIWKKLNLFWSANSYDKERLLHPVPRLSRRHIVCQLTHQLSVSMRSVLFLWTTLESVWPHHLFLYESWWQVPPLLHRGWPCSWNTVSAASQRMTMFLEHCLCCFTEDDHVPGTLRHFLKHNKFLEHTCYLV